ncbi:MAG: hypothetical protein MI784_03655 [Cytophagales bacterium]|nr:hypothetical protein [Cytophagales bacterium]
MKKYTLFVFKIQILTMKTFFKAILILCFTAGTKCLLAQAKTDKPERYYYNEALTELDGPEGARYYMEFTKAKKGKWVCYQYEMSSGKLIEAFRCPEKGSIKKAGVYNKYFPNGKLKEKGVKVDGKYFGTMISYYPSGQMMEKREYHARKGGFSFDCKFLQVWTEQGEELIVNGNSGIIPLGKGTEVQIKNNKAIMARYYDMRQKDFVYWIAGKAAAHKRGKDFFMNWIISQVKFPSSKKKQLLEGKVDIYVFIGKTGEILAVRFGRVLHKDVQRQITALVVKSSGNWRTGKYNGEKVNMITGLTIDFQSL